MLTIYSTRTQLRKMVKLEKIINFIFESIELAELNKILGIDKACCNTYYVNIHSILTTSSYDRLFPS